MTNWGRDRCGVGSPECLTCKLVMRITAMSSEVFVNPAGLTRPRFIRYRCKQCGEQGILNVETNTWGVPFNGEWAVVMEEAECESS